MNEPPSKSINPEEWADLVRTRTPALILFAQQWCRSPEDVVQDAWLQLFQKRPPPARPMAWMFTVVRRRAINAMRSARRRRNHEEGAALIRSPWFESSGEDGLDIGRLESHIRKLPSEQREVIVARVWGTLTFEEVAELAGCSVPTAFRRYHAALQALRVLLERQDEPTRDLIPRDGEK